MLHLTNYIKPGISATMLYPRAFVDENLHLEGIKAACALPDYEILDLCLPFDKHIRDEEISLLRQSGKQIYLNAHPVLQQDGMFNPCSDEPEIRARALRLMLDHIRWAGALGAPVLVYTANVDKGDAARQTLWDRLSTLIQACDQEAARQGVVMALEPIERHRFKKLFLGPTAECCAFVNHLRQAGCTQAGLIVDVTHLPLMEEDISVAFAQSAEVGISHIHLGGAVLDPNSPFYGHTHPPLGVDGSLFDTAELSQQLRYMFQCGYLSASRRSPMSFEIQQLPGYTPEETAAIHYRKLEEAFSKAAEEEGIG